MEGLEDGLYQSIEETSKKIDELDTQIDTQEDFSKYEQQIIDIFNTVDGLEKIISSLNENKDELTFKLDSLKKKLADFVSDGNVDNFINGEISDAKTREEIAQINENFKNEIKSIISSINPDDIFSGNPGNVDYVGNLYDSNTPEGVILHLSDLYAQGSLSPKQFMSEAEGYGLQCGELTINNTTIPCVVDDYEFMALVNGQLFDYQINYPSVSTPVTEKPSGGGNHKSSFKVSGSVKPIEGADINKEYLVKNYVTGGFNFGGVKTGIYGESTGPGKVTLGGLLEKKRKNDKFSFKRSAGSLKYKGWEFTNGAEAVYSHIFGLFKTNDSSLTLTGSVGVKVKSLKDFDINKFSDYTYGKLALGWKDQKSDTTINAFARFKPNLHSAGVSVAPSVSVSVTKKF